MGKQSNRRGKQAEKRLRVRSIRQDPPNVDRLTKTLLDMAMRQAAQEQQAQAARDAPSEASHD
ncbi:hypothetical protein [Arthrobacter sp. 2MCAF14]|uniref:hypothetical protein n=1 Tax=Arthrobacter sp. 2MCAF14 TaxID=3232982 RepID=UPI003F936C0E